MMKWILALGLIGLVIVAALLFPLQGSRTFKASDFFSPFRLKEASTLPEISDFSVSLGDTTYRGTATSDVGVAVMDVVALPSGVVAMVDVYNGQHDAITLSPSLFEIVDSQGNVYSGSADLSANDALSVAAKLNPIFMSMISNQQFNSGVLTGQSNVEELTGKLNPGVTRCGPIIFEVPRNLNKNNLTLRFHSGATGSFVDLPLKVNSSVKSRPATDMKPQSDGLAAAQQETTSAPDPNVGNSQTSPTETQQQPASQAEPATAKPQPSPASMQQAAPIVRETPSNSPSPQSPN